MLIRSKNLIACSNGHEKRLNAFQKCLFAIRYPFIFACEMDKR